MLKFVVTGRQKPQEDDAYQRTCSIFVFSRELWAYIQITDEWDDR